MKNHLKRIFTPASWLISRKTNKYIVKPRPGAHSREFSLPLTVVLKELGYSQTTRDVKNILRNQEVLIDGKKRKDHRFNMGLMDVLSLPAIKKHHIMVLDKKGRLIIKEINEKDSKIKIAKVLNRRVVKKGKFQINLHDGKNILTQEKVKVGDSVVLELPSNKIKQVLELKKDAHIYLLKGSHVGSQGVLQEIKEKMIIFQKDKEKIETLKNYAMVIGEKEPLIKIEND